MNPDLSTPSLRPAYEKEKTNAAESVEIGGAVFITLLYRLDSRLLSHTWNASLKMEEKSNRAPAARLVSECKTSCSGLL